MQGKYYEKSDIDTGVLHKDMTVSVDSLSKITGMVILLDKGTFIYNEDEIGFGRIVYIGEKYPQGVKSENVISIYNEFDMSPDNLSIEGGN